MITVKFLDGQNRILVSGHAGYAESGHDIICAGVSSLAWALAASLHRAGRLLEMKEDAGEMDIRYKGGNSECIDMFQTGVELMESKHGDYIRVEGRKSIIYDDTIEPGKGGAATCN